MACVGDLPEFPFPFTQEPNGLPHKVRIKHGGNLASIYYVGKQEFATHAKYYVMMSSNEAINENVRENLAKNLDMLMHLRKPRWKQIELAEAAGIAQRTVGNMLKGNDDVSGSTLDRVEAVAGVFGLRTWHLLVPTLPNDLHQARIMCNVITDYILADEDGRDLIHRVAQREAKITHLGADSTASQHKGSST